MRRPCAEAMLRSIRKLGVRKIRLLDSNIFRKSPVGLRIPALRVKILLESNPLKSRILVRGLAVHDPETYCGAPSIAPALADGPKGSAEVQLASCRPKSLSHHIYNTYIYIYIEREIYIYIYICTYIHKYIYTYTYTSTYMCIYIYTYIHTYIYTYIYTHIHTYIHIDNIEKLCRRSSF